MGAYRRALTASGKSSSEGLREILGIWVSHRFVAGQNALRVISSVLITTAS